MSDRDNKSHDVDAITACPDQLSPIAHVMAGLTCCRTEAEQVAVRLDPHPTDGRSAPGFHDSLDAEIAEAMKDPEYAAASRRIERRDRWKIPVTDAILRLRHLVTFGRAHDFRARFCDHGDPCWGTHPICKVCGADGAAA